MNHCSYDLGTVYVTQASDEAEELYKRALAGNEEKLGSKHPDTLRTVCNWASFLEDCGRADEE